MSAAGARADRWIAAGLAAGTFALMLGTSREVGFVRDEGYYFTAARSYGEWFARLARDPRAAVTDAEIVRYWDYNHEHPVLVKSLFALSGILFTEKLGWTRPATGYRLPAFAFAGLLSACLYLLGLRLGGSRRASLFAVAALWTIPRVFFHGHLAAFDVAVTAMWVACAYAYLRALDSRAWGPTLGLVWGLALATKNAAVFLPAVLGFHFVAARPAPWRRGLWIAAWMAVLGPLVFYLHWPYLWHDPWPRFRWYLEFHTGHVHYPWQYLGDVLRAPPFPWHYPWVVNALTVPVTTLALMAAGLLRELPRSLSEYRDVARRSRRQPRRRSRSDDAQGRRRRARSGGALPMRTPQGGGASGAPSEARNSKDLDRAAAGARSAAAVGAILRQVPGRGSLLVVLNVLFWLALFSTTRTPIFGGIKHWMPAFPFLALLAGRALEAAADAAAGALALRRAPLFAALAALALLPAAWGTARIHPYGTSFYNEAAGGLPGAAKLGMQRQFWSNNVTGVLPWLNDHLRPNRAVNFHEVNWESHEAYIRNGMLRPDLRWVYNPEEGDCAAIQYHQEFRDFEFRARRALGREPVAGLYLDETPQVVVYCRPGTLKAPPGLQ